MKWLRLLKTVVGLCEPDIIMLPDWEFYPPLTYSIAQSSADVHPGGSSRAVQCSAKFRSPNLSVSPSWAGGVTDCYTRLNREQLSRTVPWVRLRAASLSLSAIVAFHEAYMICIGLVGVSVCRSDRSSAPRTVFCMFRRLLDLVLVLIQGLAIFLDKAFVQGSLPKRA